MGASIAAFSPLIIWDRSLQQMIKFCQLRKEGKLFTLGEKEKQQCIEELEVLIDCIEASANNHELNLGVSLPDVNFNDPEECMQWPKKTLASFKEKKKDDYKLFDAAKYLNELQVNVYLPCFKVMQFFLRGTISKEQMEEFMDYGSHGTE